MDRESEPFARFHFLGIWDADGTEMIAAIGMAVRNPAIKMNRLPWFLLKLASPCNEATRPCASSRRHAHSGKYRSSSITPDLSAGCEQILAASRAIGVREGWKAVTILAVAQKLGYTDSVLIYQCRDQTVVTHRARLL
jgi:hypothetical protein